MAISASYKKVYPSATSAIGQIPDGSTVLIGGFGPCGTPNNLILALKESGAKELTTVSNNLQGESRWNS
jgi:3-oxoacid CoA-transferase subunit A